MNYRIRHTTRYSYQGLVSHCFNEARMTPPTVEGQSCARTRFVIHPTPDAMRQRLDYFGNQVTVFEILKPHTELTVTVYSDVQMEDSRQELLFLPDVAWNLVRDQLAEATLPESLAVREFVLPSPLVPVLPGVREYAALSFVKDRSLVDALTDLNSRIFTDFVYDPASTTIATPLEEVLKNKRGVCQDFAHVAIACIRTMGLPARYVSGYLETLPPEGEEKLVGADASHAWFSAWLPEYGWLAFDPTNNVRAGAQHIVLAHGRDFGDVTPLKGVIFGGGQHQLSVAVDVTRQVLRP